MSPEPPVNGLSERLHRASLYPARRFPDTKNARRLTA